MNNSTLAAGSSAIPDLQELMTLLGPQCLELLATIRTFRAQSPTPERTYDFENETAAIVREAARVVVDHAGDRHRGDAS